jgi:hypothetical protein
MTITNSRCGTYLLTSMTTAISQYCRILALIMTYSCKHNLVTVAALPLMRRAYALRVCSVGVHGAHRGALKSYAGSGEAVCDQ